MQVTRSAFSYQEQCHIINYLLTELAQAVPGNIGPRSFLYGPRWARSVLSRPRANIPQYGPRARLVRSYWGPLDSRTRTTTSTRFSHRTTLSARKPASFWREKRDTVVILVRGFAKMLSCQNKSRPL